MPHYRGLPPLSKFAPAPPHRPCGSFGRKTAAPGPAAAASVPHTCSNPHWGWQSARAERRTHQPGRPCQLAPLQNHESCPTSAHRVVWYPASTSRSSPNTLAARSPSIVSCASAPESHQTHRDVSQAAARVHWAGHGDRAGRQHPTTRMQSGGSTWHPARHPSQASVHLWC